MGQKESSLIENIAVYCKEESKLSKQCMFKYNYDREAYRKPCAKEFQEYKNCKERWLVLRKKVMAGELLDAFEKEA
jgi:hypothetical protein